MGQKPEEIRAEIEATRHALEGNVDRFNRELTRTTDNIKQAGVKYGTIAAASLVGMIVIKLIRRRSKD